MAIGTSYLSADAKKLKIRKPEGALTGQPRRALHAAQVFDPASNLLDDKVQQLKRPLNQDSKRNKFMDNMLREYAGTHYAYDECGNLTQRPHNGVRAQFAWSAGQLQLRPAGPALAQALGCVLLEQAAGRHGLEST